MRKMFIVGDYKTNFPKKNNMMEEGSKSEPEKYRKSLNLLIILFSKQICT